MKQHSNMTRMQAFKKYYLQRWRLYMFMLLPLAYIIIFSYIPMFGIQIAFKDYDFAKGIWGSDWVGFKHFIRFFQLYNFKEIFFNTLILSLYSFFVSFPLPIILALILNAFPGVHFKKIVQSVSYMPHFISTVVLIGMMMQFLSPRAGAVGIIYTAITGNVMKDLFGNPDAFRHLYVWSGIWQGIGWGSIIYIAALSGVDVGLHEAAEIDGATRVQRVIHIDFPSILPTVTILMIMSISGILGVGFEKVYLLQNNLNLAKSEVISTYVYKVGLTIGTGDYSFSTAIGLFNSVISFILLTIANTISRHVSENSLW